MKKHVTIAAGLMFAFGLSSTAQAQKIQIAPPVQVLERNQPVIRIPPPVLIPVKNPVQRAGIDEFKLKQQVIHIPPPVLIPVKGNPKGLTPKKPEVPIY